MHSGSQAARLTRAVNARAFAVGRDVVFGAGQYAPDTKEKAQLLAHELTHVVQQGRSTGPAVLRRYEYGSGTPPEPTYVEVPDDERSRVEDGMRIVTRIVINPNRYRRCHRAFQNDCPSPGTHELIDRFNAAVIWKETDTDPEFRFGSSVPPDHIAYTDESWRWGRWTIAATAMHEFVHRCGFDNEDRIERIVGICGLPGTP